MQQKKHSVYQIIILNRKLYKELLKFQTSVPAGSIDYVKSLIGILTEYLLESEKESNAEIFDMFCELKLLNCLSNLSLQNNYDINYALIQSLSFLLINIRNVDNLYYLLSNDIVNSIITINPNDYDDEFLSFYINFLKSLSLRINEDSINFFYNVENNTFPLVENAIKLYNYSNSMISTVVHSIILAVLSVKNNEIKEHFVLLPTINYFVFLICNLRDLIVRFIEDATDNKDYFDDIVDELMYINDLMCIHIEEINYVIINCFGYYILFPLVFKRFLEPNQNSERIFIVLILFFTYLKEEWLVNVLFALVFHEKSLKNFEALCRAEPTENKNYFFSWKEQSQQKKNFSNFISCVFSEKMLASLKINNSNLYLYIKEYTELEEIRRKCFDTYKSNNFKITTEEISQILFQGFTQQELNSIKEYHHSITLACGVKVGLLQDKNNPKIENCLVGYMKNFFSNCFLKSDSKKLPDNSLRKKMLCELQSQNPKIINLLLWVINSKSKPSKILMSHCGFRRHKKTLVDSVFQGLSFDATITKEEEKLLQKNDVFDHSFFFAFSNLYLQDDRSLCEEFVAYFLDLLSREMIQDELMEMVCFNIVKLNNYNSFDDMNAKIKSFLDDHEMNKNFEEGLYVKYANMINDEFAFDREIKRLYTLVGSEQRKTVARAGSKPLAGGRKKELNPMIFVILRKIPFDFLTIKPNERLEIKYFESFQKESLVFTHHSIFFSSLFLYIAKTNNEDVIEQEIAPKVPMDTSPRTVVVKNILSLRDVKIKVTKEKNFFILNLNSYRIPFENTPQSKKNLELAVNAINRNRIKI